MFEEFLRRMLGRVSNTRDKRQGGIIYDTLAPTAAELAQMNISKAIFEEQTYLLTATGVNLDNRAADYGIVRDPATASIRIAQMSDTNGNPIVLPVGSRFGTPNTVGLTFTLTSPTETPGTSLLTCETPGTVGNAYLGALLPLFAINNLGAAVMVGTYTPGEDIETDEQLRRRVLDRINQKSYGGNVADYKAFTGAIDGVGAVKVFPAWDGGGTVKLSILDSEYNAATPEFVDLVQTKVDPIPSNGEGLGIAPIGHRVTVVTPSVVPMNVAATLSLKPGYTISQLQSAIERAVYDYLHEVRREWADLATVSVFTARIGAAIISVEGVNNVTNITVNDSPDDMVLVQTALQQQIPALESVVLGGA